MLRQQVNSIVRSLTVLFFHGPALCRSPALPDAGILSGPVGMMDQKQFNKNQKESRTPGQKPQIRIKNEQ